MTDLDRLTTSSFVAIASLGVLLIAAAALPLAASSHREAPFVTENPKIDGTDFYMFRSYEPGRAGFVTLIANYSPLQDAYGGPNYFTLDPEARYRINIENDGDPEEDLVFEFRFFNRLAGQTVPVGGEDVAHPLRTITPLPPVSQANETEFYSVTVIRGDERLAATNSRTGSGLFAKALDNFGEKTFPDYESYARRRVTEIQIPGCGGGRVFVGQRKESFAVNLGETFDLVNLNPVGPPFAERSSTEDKNITALALEVPIDCLTAGNGDVIGGWTTALLRRNRSLERQPTFDAPESISGGLVQVSRLGMPLVNEVVIGLEDKNLFNASHPSDDLENFALYVTHPTLPELLQVLFGVEAPNHFPRTDLVAAFVTGIEGVNALGVGEMQRLNTAVPPTPKAEQNRLGVIGGDLGGFPNGRRPGDDVVDISLRAVMGILCHAGLGLCDPDDAPAGTLPYTDQTYQAADQFDAAFPYLTTPLPGSANPFRVFNANLQGAQQNPPITTAATGGCGAVLDVARTELAVSCTHDVTNPTLAHIHFGAPGENGPILCDLIDPISPIQFLCNADNVADFPAFLAALEQGNTYVNIHSAENQSGEIRGQLD